MKGKRPQNIAALILAAGFSSRMGAFKPLLPFGESSVIETVVNTFRQAGVADIRVVVGWQAERLRPVLDQLQVTVVINERYEEGMFSSVLAGLHSFTEQPEGVLLLPVDTPMVKQTSIKTMLRKFRQTDSAVVYPVFRGRRGHPPLISGKYFDNILAVAGSGTLKSALECLAPAINVEVPDRGVLLDIDTPADYEELNDYRLGKALPTCEDAVALLKDSQPSNKVIQHSLAVATAGRQLADKLNKAGLHLNSTAVEVGGILHDIAKGKPHHARQGAKLMKRYGYPRLAGIIATHMDLIFDDKSTLDEAAIVFLADKLTHEGQIVSVEERFENALQRFSNEPDKVLLIKQRMSSAQRILARISGILGGCHCNDIKLQDYKNFNC
ncbi:DVU_1551 family NTP transferase [Sporomusa sp.]|uniref:DVU_1551 family NTP transferase n=1 Tax=Sporomusa sp. TaxID=2078658 RepID=UPI002C452D04|nr:NTP transferase domain-containing protein [Sporomusa sp.]HWR06079.1 NTP transferase domain-containing protein [Sporomusa sp.]